MCTDEVMYVKKNGMLFSFSQQTLIVRNFHGAIIFIMKHSVLYVSFTKNLNFRK